VRHIDIDWHTARRHTGNERDHVAGLVIQVAGLKHIKPGQQRLALDCRQPVHARLLHQLVVHLGQYRSRLAKIAAGLQRYADFVERHQIGLALSDFVEDERPPYRPSFMVLFEV